MRLISIDEITGKEITAEDIRSDIDFILIPKDTQLKTSYIPALKNLGIHEICIKDSIDETIKSNEREMLFPKEMLEYYVESLNQIMEKDFNSCDFFKVEVLAEKIVDFIKNNPNLKYNMKMERTQTIREHSVVVTILSILIGLKLDLTRSRLYQIAIACLIHDMDLLNASFPIIGVCEEELNPEELEKYYKHPVKVWEQLSDIPWITDDAKEIVLSHHERVNGRGFPHKKKRQSIGCRIVQVTDAFDCKCIGLEDRKYGLEELYDFMESRKNCRFDRTIVEFLFQVIAK